jgi:RHS repeat-associated protein
VDTLFYPWGQPVNSSVESLWAGFNDGNGWLLHEWQTDTRRYTPSAGRWFTPDPLGGDVTNPQSLNRYAYVLNNPTSLTDPLGLGSEECSQSNDDNDCCNDPNYVGAECGGPGWPPGFWPPDWGGGGGGGGGGSSPTPTPTANDGSPGNDFIGLPCVQDVSDLIPWIYLGLAKRFPNAKIGPITAVTGPGGVVGGAQVFNVPNITPTTDVPYDWPKIPGFGPGHYQVYTPVPEKPTGGQNGAGNILHVEYDVSTNSAGQVTAVTGIYAHWDIGNPVKGHGIGIPWHLLADFGISRASSKLCGGGPVKFE